VIFDVESTQVVGVGERPGRDGKVVDFTMAAGLLYAAYTDNSIRVWEGSEWKGSFRGHEGPVLCLQVSGDELYTGSHDRTIRCWNLHTAQGNILWHGRNAHNGPIWSLAVNLNAMFFTDGDRVVAQDINTGERLYKLEGNQGTVRRLMLTPHDGLLYTTGPDGLVRIWDSRSATLLAILEAHEGPVTCLFGDPRGFVFSGGADCTVREWTFTLGAP
jgi:WD40 repeat protein